MLEVGSDRQARGEPGDRDTAAKQLGDVVGGRLAGGGRVGREHDLGHLGVARAGDQLGDLQVLRVDPVDRRERPAEHVVEPAVLVSALDRDHVGGLLDDTDRGAVPARVLADLAARALGEVEADLAESDLLLHLADRVGERPGLGVLGAQDVKGEPLRGPLADPRELRQLGDQAVDRLGVHGPGEASGRPGPTHG